MKVVLASNEEFNVSVVFKQSENQLCIAFTGVIDYALLRSKLNSSAMTLVKFYTDETSFEEYRKYTKFVSATITELQDGTCDVAVYFDKEDEASYLVNQIILGNLTYKTVVTSRPDLATDIDLYIQEKNLVIDKTV